MRMHVRGIDHVVIAVHDLDAALDTFRRMGFTVTPRGYHSIGSQNHCVMLGDDYIELLAVPADSAARRDYSEFLATGEGLAALALATDNARAAYTEMLWAGFEPTDPVDFSRPVDVPGGRTDARFRITQLALAKTPGAKVFLCEHFTRETVWHPEYQSHVNSATGLAAVAIMATDPAAAAKPYERLFDARAEAIPEGLLVRTGNRTPIAFVTDRSLAKRLPQVWISARPEPMVAALFIHVADRDAARRGLEEGGLAPRRMPDGSFAVGADRGHGIALVFG